MHVNQKAHAEARDADGGELGEAEEEQGGVADEIGLGETVHDEWCGPRVQRPRKRKDTREGAWVATVVMFGAKYRRDSSR